MDSGHDPPPAHGQQGFLLGALVLVLVVLVGLYVVKWNPYSHKAVEAACSRALGGPIAGKDAPRPSLGAQP